MELALVILGLAIATGALSVILWSIVFPAQRLWPPKHYTALTPFIVWLPTFTLFGILVVLGLLGWNDALPAWFKFGIGVPLIAIGNVAVWFEVMHFGMAQTGGAKGVLRTEGLYRFSRNPQYIADISMIIGWIILTSAPWVLVVGIVGIMALIAAPFAEEPWLRNQYGSEFVNYASKVRRFI